MNGSCPNCGKESSLYQIKQVEEIDIRGEKIPVEVEYYRCQECGEEFEFPRPDYHPLETAYIEYRRRKGMIKPEEIRAFRKKYGLSQKELSEVFGIGVATLSRYENGALQDEAHDRVLQLGMQPENLLRLLESNPRLLTEKKRSRLLGQLKKEKSESDDWVEMGFSKYGNYSPDIFSGYCKLNITKLFQAIKFFCYPDGVFKTKLTKLLFYTDFKHYKEYSVSITGCKYAHLPYGPVPDQFDTWFTLLLTKDPSIEKSEVWCNEYPGEVYKSKEPAGLSLFTASELRTLATVKEKFEKCSAKDMQDISHQETAYQVTRNSELIPYSYAEELSI